MFRYGGPIKEGIMDGIREPKRDGNIVGGRQSPKLAGAHPLKLESLATTGGLDQLVQLFGYSGLFKDGGRVRGCGKAKRGFGKVMKRKK